MFKNAKCKLTLICVVVVTGLVAVQCLSAEEDLVQIVSGVVKHVDKGTKTVVIKTSDGTEHTIKWTDKTTVKGVDASGKAVADASVDSYDGLKEGAKVSVKYTEKGGEKTAVAIKDASKATAKAVAQ